MDKVKVISLFGNNHYSDIFPSIPVLYETTRFVQFDAFALHLPVIGPGSRQAGGELNIFELTMLRMLAAGRFSPQKIAEELCLPPDFTAAVLAGLRERGYLTDQNIVSEIGSGYLGKKPGGNPYDTKSFPKTTFYVPVRRDTGEVIPVLFERDALETGEADFSGHRLTIWHGSAGKEEAIQGRMITVKRVHQKRGLDQKEIRKIIRLYNKYSGQYMNIPADQFIESSFESNISGIFVQMKFVVQMGDVKYILASEGVRDHSTRYLDYMRDIYNQRINKNFDAEILRSALNYTEKGGTNGKEPGGSYKYQKIRDNLIKLPKHSDAANMDEQTEYKEEENRSIREYLSAMEWALDAYLRRIGIPDSLCQILQAQGGAANAELLFEMGKQAGIYGMETVKPLFLNVSFAAFTNWQKRGEPSLRLLFPLACGLQLRKPECTFAEAVGAMGTAMVLRLSKYAASVRHNERLQLEKGDTIDTLYGAVHRFVKTLLPDYESDGTERLQKQAAGNASERWIAKEVWLRDQLGDDLYTMLPEELKKSLRETSDDDLRMVMEETALVPGFILSLSSALEKEFQRIIHRPAAVKEIGFVQARLRGISALPSGLARVNPVRYQAAASGKKSTLGAYALVWAGTLSDEGLENASKAFVLAKVDEIAGARGHGTGAEDFRKEDLEKLRSNTIDVIRYLENSYDGGGQ